MARLKRLFVPGEPQHIIQRGNNRQVIFQDEADCARFLDLLRDASVEHELAIHSYVLMPNHLHLLVTPAKNTSISRVMQSVGRRYVRHFNLKAQRTGTLWEGRYKSTVIDSEQYFMVCSRYIELNPVRAGLVDAPQAYPWSSYRHHIGLAANAMITDHALYWNLGNTPFERQAAYRQMLEEGLTTEQLGRIRDATNKGWVLGSAEFAELLNARANRRATRSHAGRPIGSLSRMKSAAKAATPHEVL